MSRRLRRMTSREVESILQRYGFQLISQRGSHRKWRNQALGVQVIVPLHRGKNLPLGTLRTILETAKLPEDEWKG